MFNVSSPIALSIDIANGIARAPKGSSLFRGHVPPVDGYAVALDSLKPLKLAKSSVERVRKFEPLSDKGSGAIVNWVRWNWSSLESMSYLTWTLDRDSGSITIQGHELIGDVDKAVKVATARNLETIKDIARNRTVPMA